LPPRPPARDTFSGKPLDGGGEGVAHGIPMPPRAAAFWSSGRDVLQQRGLDTARVAA